MCPSWPPSVAGQRAHGPRVDRAVGQDRIPALPDRRRALLHLVQPRRGLAPQEHQVRLVDVARRRRARAAPAACPGTRWRRCPSAPRAPGWQGPPRRAPRSLGGAIPSRRARRSAGLRRDARARASAPRSGRRPLSASASISQPASLVPEEPRPPPRPAARSHAKNALARKLRVGLGLPRPVRRRVGIQPVAELRCRDRAAHRRRGAPPATRPRPHAVQLVVRAPRRSPYASYTDHGTIVAASAQPARPNAHRLAEHDVRDDARHAQHRRPARARGPAASSPRTPPASKSVRAGRREGLRVAGPAEPLVALRAVGGHGDEVVALGPHARSRAAGSAPRREHSNVARAGCRC